MKRILTVLLIAGMAEEVLLTDGLSWMLPLGSLSLTGESNLAVMLALGLALSVGMIGISAVVLRKCLN